MPALRIDFDQLEVGHFVAYHGSVIQDNGSSEQEIVSRISRVRLIFTNLQHLWKKRDVGLINTIRASVS